MYDDHTIIWLNYDDFNFYRDKYMSDIFIDDYISDKNLMFVIFNVTSTYNQHLFFGTIRVLSRYFEF